MKTFPAVTAVDPEMTEKVVDLPAPKETAVFKHFGC